MNQPKISARETQKKTEVSNFLQDRVFDPILNSPAASDSLKRGARYTIMRMNEHDAAGIVHYYWSAVIGTERSVQPELLRIAQACL